MRTSTLSERRQTFLKTGAGRLVLSDFSGTMTLSGSNAISLVGSPKTFASPAIGTGTLTLSGAVAPPASPPASAPATDTGGRTLVPGAGSGSPSPAAEQLDAERTTTEVFRLKQVKAADVLPTISPLIDAAKGKILADTRSNSLVVTERPSRMKAIRPIIEELDRASESAPVDPKK